MRRRNNPCGPNTTLHERVVFAYPHNGTEADRATAGNLLSLGTVYEVKDVRVYAYRTELVLMGIPKPMNSVLFCPASQYQEPPTPDEDEVWNGRAY